METAEALCCAGPAGSVMTRARRNGASGFIGTSFVETDSQFMGSLDSTTALSRVLGSSLDCRGSRGGQRGCHTESNGVRRRRWPMIVCRARAPPLLGLSPRNVLPCFRVPGALGTACSAVDYRPRSLRRAFRVLHAPYLLLQHRLASYPGARKQGSTVNKTPSRSRSAFLSRPRARAGPSTPAPTAGCGKRGPRASAWARRARPGCSPAGRRSCARLSGVR